MAADKSRNDDVLSKSRLAKKRFLDSMEMNYEKWHDGIGYDLAALDEMTEVDKDSIVDILSSDLTKPWHAFEALEYLSTPKALSIIKDNLKHPSLTLRIAASRFAKGADKEREQVLIEALAKSEFYEGLTQALGQIGTFHPLGVIDALLRGLLVRGDSAAVNFAAMLLYVCGKTNSTFDLELPTLFLRFGSNDVDERKQAFAVLCGLIELDPKPYLRSMT